MTVTIWYGYGVEVQLEKMRMRSATIDGSTQELLTAARPGDLLIQVGEPARVGVVVKACSEAPRFHVVPCDTKAPEVWTDSLRLIKLTS